MFYRPDCVHFRGSVPCQPHKRHGYHCETCPVYAGVEQRILIIKLGAMGDVIRTTPLVTRYRELYPQGWITWVTLFPDVLPADCVDEVLPLGVEAALYVTNTRWDIAINLDKEKEAGALLAQVQAAEKFGFVLKDGVCQPVNERAHHKFRTGLFDDDSRANTKSYCTEIFEICGLEYRGEPYLLDPHRGHALAWDLPANKPIVGLNTGCGDRWTTRLWSVAKWVELARSLTAIGAAPLLLGGRQEHARNLEIQAASGALYTGYHPLPTFIALVDRCDLVVTQVTMALHIGLGLGKKIVLMNNIFNPREFDLGNQGRIVAPPRACDCFYRGTCVHGVSCMESLEPGTVREAIRELLAS